MWLAFAWTSGSQRMRMLRVLPCNVLLPQEAVPAHHPPGGGLVSVWRALHSETLLLSPPGRCRRALFRLINSRVEELSQSIQSEVSGTLEVRGPGHGLCPCPACTVLHEPACQARALNPTNGRRKVFFARCFLRICLCSKPRLNWLFVPGAFALLRPPSQVRLEPADLRLRPPTADQFHVNLQQLFALGEVTGRKQASEEGTGFLPFRLMACSSGAPVAYPPGCCRHQAGD